jgi:type II secretory pathway pseudopilin PulG
MRRKNLRSAKRQITNHKSQMPQRGYMMITLMLFVALITIALLGVLPAIKQQIRRDREEELIHRGTAYMRAIQHFNKKFGRYPSRVEELENTNNVRFLRKRYTDPVNVDPATGKEKEFKLLHQQDITLNNGPVLGQPIGQGGAPATGGFGSQSGPGNQSSFGNSSSPFGGQPGGAQQQNSANSQAAGTDSGNSSNSNQPGSPSSGSSSDSGGNSSGFNGPTFGGGPILGVASLSKDKTIRVFFDKNHYKDWLFIYVPTIAQIGLLTGPVNPNMPPAGSLTPGMPLPGQAPNSGFSPNTPGFNQSTPPPSATQTTPNTGQTPPQQ